MLAALWFTLPRSAPQLSLLRQGDWLGISLMAVGLAAFQTVLDDGNVYNWFDSPSEGKDAHAKSFLYPRHRLADRQGRHAKLPSRNRETSGFRRLNEGIQRSQTVPSANLH
jgi:hypothetical protein